MATTNTDAHPQPTSADPTPAPTPPHPTAAGSGTWGEHTPGEPVSVRRGLHQFGRLARETSRLSETNGNEGVMGRGRSTSVLERGGEEKVDEEAVIETPRAGSVPASAHPGPGEEGTYGEPPEPPSTLADADAEDQKDGFDLRAWIESRAAAESARGITRKKLGVRWRALGVAAPAPTDTLFIKTLPRAIAGTFGPDLYRILSGLVAPLLPKAGGPTMPILQGHNGVLRPGEMLLVLGRPGSGCTTLLRALAASLPPGLGLGEGSEVSYGGFGPEEIRRKLRGEVVYSGEDDLHYAHLSVKQTLRCVCAL